MGEAVKLTPVAPPSSNTAIEFIDLKAQRRRLGDRIDLAVKRVIDAGNYIMGPEVALLEKQLSAFCGAKHSISCSNGTDAITLALKALGVGPGDAVACPTFTFAATAETIALCGATPIFLDVLPDSFNLDPAALPGALVAAKKAGLTLKGIISVDLFGQPCDYPAIEDFCSANGLFLIDDAAQGFGGTLNGRRIGQFGQITTTSFFPAKPLGCYGDGGAIFTDDDRLAEILKSLRVHGKGTDKYDNVRIGLNGRLDTIQAAILIEKLAIFPDELTSRQQVADRYEAGLADLVATPKLIPGATSSWAQYTLRLEGRNRDAAIASLQSQGVPSVVYYPKPLHEQTAYKNFPNAGCPISSALAQDVLSLPMHPYLDPTTQARIIEAARVALKR